MSRSFHRLEPQNIVEILTRIYEKAQSEHSLEAKEIIQEMIFQLEAYLTQKLT
ncbi:hypothetical protein [Ammoniphilus sp. YIM 78166]|uniref:hypothetical protein n=1 Tax=Ammoniphilus sp. YIM 78166 TaxID=1644106 RepID=UPI0014320E37|nr:hypothetical protein [Ammoniphilus sp. YIM 78166]